MQQGPEQNNKRLSSTMYLPTYSIVYKNVCFLFAFPPQISFQRPPHDQHHLLKVVGVETKGRK